MCPSLRPEGLSPRRPFSSCPYSPKCLEEEFDEVRYPHATPKQQQEYAVEVMHISPLVASMSACAGELGSSVGKEDSAHVDRREGSVRYDTPLDGTTSALRRTGRPDWRSHRHAPRVH